MADKKVSQDNSHITIANGDYFPTIDVSEASPANRNKKLTFSTLLAWINSNITAVSSSQLVSKTSTYTLTTDDDGKIFYNEGGNLVIDMPAEGVLPLGFEYGIMTTAGDSRDIETGGDDYTINGIDDSYTVIKNHGTAGTHFLKLKLTKSDELSIVTALGSWKGDDDSSEFNVLYSDGAQGGCYYDGAVTTGADLDFDDSNHPKSLNQTFYLAADDDLEFHNRGLKWSGAVGRVIIYNRNLVSDITLTLGGSRIDGISTTHLIPSGETHYFEANRLANTLTFWVKAGSGDSGSSSSSTEAVNRTGATIALSDKEAIYNDADLPETGDTLTFSDTDAKNGAVGFVYWQANSSGDLPTITYSGGTHEVVSSEIAADAIHRVWYTFHKKTGKNSLQIVIKPSNTPPQALNIVIGGAFSVGGSLSANWDYFDADGDAHDESGDAYQWYRADDVSGTGEAAISGAENQIYVLTGSDEGKVLKCIITPKALTGSKTGSATDSGYNATVIVAASLLVDIESSGDYSSPTEGAGSIGSIGMLTISNDVGEVVFLPDTGDQITVNFTVPTTGDYRIYLRARTGSSSGSNSMASLYVVNHSSTDYTCGTIVSETRPYIGPISDLGTSYWGWTRSQVISLTAGSNDFNLKATADYTAIDKVELVIEP